MAGAMRIAPAAPYPRDPDRHPRPRRPPLPLPRVGRIDRGDAYAAGAGSRLLPVRVRSRRGRDRDRRCPARGGADARAHDGGDDATASTGEPLFTGDTLFLAAVGRPDLEASADEARARARLLYRSLQRLAALPGETLVLPGHTSSPVAFDGEPIVGTLAEVLGADRDAAPPRGRLRRGHPGAHPADPAQPRGDRGVQRGRGAAR